MAGLVKGIAHTAYTVSDMEASLKFYHDALGFERAFDIPDSKGNPWIVYVHAGRDQFIELFYGGENRIEYKDSNIGYSHLCLEVTDIYALAENIEKAGYKLDSAPRFLESDNNWQAWVRDPDGNRIELMQMGEASLQNRYIREHT